MNPKKKPGRDFDKGPQEWCNAGVELNRSAVVCVAAGHLFSFVFTSYTLTPVCSR
jgi:hypothetical protein